MLTTLFTLFEPQIRAYCEDLSKRVPARIIPGRNALDKYLGRYYVTNRTRKDEERDDTRRKQGEDVVDKPNAYLHYFFRGDDDVELHNHPWKYSVSLILTGGYIEERRTKTGHIYTRSVLPGTLNFIRASDYHRVDLLDPTNGAWTLFISYKRCQDWYFWHPVTGVYTQWEKFLGLKSEDINKAIT